MLVALKVTLILVLQFLIGYGVNQKLAIRAKPNQLLGLAIMSGLGVSSVITFILEIIRIPLGYTSISLALLVAASLFWKEYAKMWSNLTGRIKLPKVYELLFLGVITFLVFISAWRCFYYPVTSFDSKVGIDLVAKYALLEGTIASTVFTNHLPSVWYWSNQPFYAPFAMLMQLIFRSTGLPFGKVWLSFLYVGFLIFFYGNLKSRTHPVVAGGLLLVFLCIPEFYAYSYIIQTDFSNALFFSVSVIIFYDYYKTTELDRSKLMLSALFMCFAVWTRSETIVIVPLGTILILYKEFPVQPGKSITLSLVYLFLPLGLFVLWNFIYLKLYLPISPATLSQINLEFDSYLTQLWTILLSMVDVSLQPIYWSYTIWIFLGVYILNLLIFRSFEGSLPLLWLAVFFVLFVFMVYHIPSVGIETTYRRGFFKFLPIFIFVLSQIPLVTRISDRITAWEYR